MTHFRAKGVEDPVVNRCDVRYSLDGRGRLEAHRSRDSVYVEPDARAAARKVVGHDRVVTRYMHPIEATVLLASPEMQLRHAAEDPKTTSVNRYDEGNGCGFDNGSPDVYVERWVEVHAGASEVLNWFAERFRAMGWELVEPVPISGVADLRLSRDPDERAGVLLQGFGEWQRHPDRAVNWLDGPNSMRVHLAVDGTFSDGSTGFRVG